MVGNWKRHNYAYRSTTNKINRNRSFLMECTENDFHVSWGFWTQTPNIHSHTHTIQSVSTTLPSSSSTISHFPTFLGIFDKTFFLSLAFESNFIQIHIDFFTPSLDIHLSCFVTHKHFIVDNQDDGKGRYFELILDIRSTVKNLSPLVILYSGIYTFFDKRKYGDFVVCLCAFADVW